MKKKRLLALGVGLIVAAALALTFGSGEFFQGKLSKSLVTKAELATLIADSNNLMPEDGSQCDIYPDVSDSEEFYYDVCTLSQLGIMKGDPYGKFNPGDPVLRAEAAKMIHSLFEVQRDCPLPQLFRDVQGGEWYAVYINQLAAYDFFSAETQIGSKFYPGKRLSKTSAKKWMKMMSKLP